MYMLDFVF